jgi:hypothetical protein
MKRVLVVVLTTGHYTYNFIKLMHNKEVLYTHFPFCLFYLHNKAGRQCTYHVTLRCIYVTIVAVEKQ